ncbi:hypothetical protein K0B04_02625 [Patescibacteria group bacterium]|nr:hypothetical protein [Patescibacteria group bacterium]
MLWFLISIIHVISEALHKSEPLPYNTEEERLAYIKEEERKRKQQRREWHENWINVERPRLIREAGLDPDNPEHVKVWKAQRKAENKKKRAEEEARRRELLGNQYTSGSESGYTSNYSSDSSSSRDYDMSDAELERFMERESNRGPVEKFIDFLLWTP